MLGWILAGGAALFGGIVAGRTVMFQPKPGPAADDTPVEFDREECIRNLQELIRCKTVSNADRSLEDDDEFSKLYALLPKLYPHVYETCELIWPGDRSLLFHWKGKSAGDPAVLMAHFDVVPAEEEFWDKPAFEGIIEDGSLWGRGTQDDKQAFNGVLSAAEMLLRQGYVPEHDIYFAFSGGEEVSGPGAKLIVSYFKEHGIIPSMVLDEGGAVVEHVFPGVDRPAAAIGLAEKGHMNVSYTVKGSGGHASAPKPHTPVGQLALACCRVENHPFPMVLSDPVRQMFDTLGRYSTPLYRTIFANLWCFGWILSLLGKKTGGTMNALLRTTVAFTKMNGSRASNVIPPEASMVSNIRIAPGETMESVLKRLQRIIGSRGIEVKIIGGEEPSRVSTTDCEGWEKLSAAVAATWKGCVVTPYLMMQGSDSHNYGEISDKVYRFCGTDMTPEEIASIHGNNEHIRLETIGRCVEFYIRLMKQL